MIGAYQSGISALPFPSRQILFLGDACQLLFVKPASASDLTLQLFVTPPTDPWGEPWQIELQQHDSGIAISPRVLQKTPADLSGGWTSSPFPPANYQAEILDHLGNIWHLGTYELSTLTGPTTILLDAVAVEGTVELDSEAWQGSLLFGGQDAVSIATPTDPKGRYSVILPRQGLWALTAEFSDGSYLDLDDVEVFSPGSGPAILDLALPAFKLEGDVYLQEKTLPQVTVLMRDPARPSVRLAGTLSDDDGHFVLRGRKAMDVVVTAVHPDSKADWVPARLEADAPTLRLDLSPFGKVRGRVLSNFGSPIADARVELRSGVDTVLPFTDRAMSSSEGTFELRSAEESGPAELLVLAPGFGIFWRELSATERTARPVEVRLSPETGILELQRVSRDLLPSLTLSGPRRTAPLSRWIETVVPFGLFSTTPAGALRLSSLEPGEYSLCLEAKCRSGLLPAGGELAFSVLELAP